MTAWLTTGVWPVDLEAADFVPVRAPRLSPGVVPWSRIGRVTGDPEMGRGGKHDLDAEQREERGVRCF